ncbi:hypothetical protein A3D11_04135 [Candidatus Peribacteria bacterium RIFCSPHIGHO2_02_FULL_49_16]|nr:MAG: hypothetical protein A2880_00225 [Candidatus Peribacteria bacterium RIFCSPHIGHO2_01_FULL_49_38]OGJ59187.1 MAG: hypothetical protein A3D11_04135 [Candidatus Peribacteria bacterium RIFCSPHIGHO2_02_FULL_49_16]
MGFSVTFAFVATMYLVQSAIPLFRILSAQEVHTVNLQRAAPPSPENNRAKFLLREVVVHVNSKEKPRSFTLRVADFPEWLSSRTLFSTKWFSINAWAVRASLENGEIAELPLPKESTLVSAERDQENVLRGLMQGSAQPGYVFDAATVARVFTKALMDESLDVTIDAEYQDNSLFIALPGEPPRRLSLLASGISNTSGSPPERLHNLKKSFTEHLHNIIIPPGETFSMIAALDTPITFQKGWKEALGLFGGGAAPTPGGGICQTSTTLYRAALLAGLPIIEQKNHSLFVDQYALFGIGLDATIFPGYHDFQFKNDTRDYLIIQYASEGDTSLLHIFGNDDERAINLDGPYFSRNNAQSPKTLRALDAGEIGWVRTITFPDGTKQSKQFISTYAKPLWRSLIDKYDGANGMELVAGKVL